MRRHPDKATKEHIQICEDWAKAAMETESNKEQLKLLLAELYDVANRSPEAMKIYRDLLADKNANAVQKAIVSNNAAFILAVMKSQPNDAKESGQLIEQAMQVIGPTADLLDTRALTCLARGDAKQAIADLKIATVNTPTATKFFHLAQAQVQANDQEAAREAMNKVRELGLTGSQLAPIERGAFAKLNDQLK